MRRRIDTLKRQLADFLNQRDDALLVVRCHAAEVVYVARLVDEIDRLESPELFWTFVEPFDTAEVWIDNVVESVRRRHDAVNRTLTEMGEVQWPAMPQAFTDRSMSPAARLRELLTFAKAMLDEDQRLVCAILPTRISDWGEYAALITEAFRYEWPDPWLTRLRLIARDDSQNTVLNRRLRYVKHVRFVDSELAPGRVVAAFEQEVTDKSVPLAERIDALFALTLIEIAERRPANVMEKLALLEHYYGSIGDKTQRSVVLNAWGEAHLATGEHELAMARFLMAAEDAIESNSLAMLMVTTSNMIDLHGRFEEWEEVATLCQCNQSLSTLLLTPTLRSWTLMNLGFAHYTGGDAEGAMKCWDEEAELARQTGEQTLLRAILKFKRDHFKVSEQGVDFQDVVQELATID